MLKMNIKHETPITNTMKKELKYEPVYEVISRWLYDKGTRFKKKHGNWIVLYAPHNQIIFMDSWNGYIYQAHSTHSAVDDGYVGSQYHETTHTVICKPRWNTCKKDLHRAIDIYKTLLTIL